MNKLYIEMYQNKLFTLTEANKIIKNYQVCKNNINRLNKQGFVTKLKAGMYFIKPLDNQEFYPNPIHIASKLRPDAVITANSALKVWKILENDDSNTHPIIYMTSKHSSKVRINKDTYKICKGINYGIEKINYQTDYGTFEIKVTDIERTILECLKTRSIKGEALINILKTKKPEINMRKILNYLERYDMAILYNKTGLIFEACKSNIKIDDSDIDRIRKKLTKKIYYFKERGIKLIRPKYHYHKEWNIMLPEHLFQAVQPLKTTQ